MIFESLILLQIFAAIHKSKYVSELLEKNKLSQLTINLYPPWLNPIESYICSIKA